MAYGDLNFTTAEIQERLERLDFWEGVNTVTTLLNLPVTKRGVVANVSGVTEICTASDLGIGKELYVKVNNTSDTEIVQPIPNSAEGKYISMSGDSVKIPSGSFVEISIWCYGTDAVKGSLYSIRVGEVSR